VNFVRLAMNTKSLQTFGTSYNALYLIKDSYLSIIKSYSLNKIVPVKL